ncbi:MAG: VOC family protein [Sporichthyaceae bacterium]|nr:VOC family protein [Sporichthyaceae bacterium]
MRLDHLSYAAGPDGLAATAQRLGGVLGAGFRDGGMHPRFGTRNFVLPLAGGTYLEVVAALDHPAADRAPFRQAVRARTENGGGWLAWVVAVDDIEPFERRLDRPSVAGHRRRPDGVDLTWRQIGLLDLLDDPALPFFVQWQVDPALHPAADAANGGAARAPGIERVEICGDRDKVLDWLGQPVGGIDFPVDWVEGEDPGLTAVHFSTARGSVRID